jgi:ABC-type bacteriocin/lantibiotic exporter with double-glycine peptidase domain
MGTVKHAVERIKEGLLKEMLSNTLWMYGYVKRYWIAIILYTLIGMSGVVMGVVSSYISKDLVDIITGHQTGQVIATFCAMIGFGVANTLVSQISSYVSNWINIRVDNEIKAEIYDKILITDWESLTTYHTGDLLTRWGSDASNISGGVLSWIPNALIYIFRFVSALAIVVVNDPSFALFALAGLPVSALMSRTLMRRMVNNNKRSAALSAKTSGFNQEAFSNIQTVKAFDLVKLYGQRLRQIQKEYLDMKMEFNRMSMFTSFILSTVGLLVSYSCYGWGIYRVWSGVISYGTMTLFLSMAGQLTGSLNSLISLVPSAISMSTSITRLRDILDMPKEDYCDDDKVLTLAESSHECGISLKISDMSYTYKTGTKVFEHAFFEAHPHEIIALVGPSGKGKTTMLRVFLSLLRTTEGNCIVYGNDESAAVPLSPSTRKLFSYVPQGNTMFSGTIAYNMKTVKPDATDEDIIEVLKKACAWEFVRELPDTINTEIKERGGGFSEGQAQRLSIARALLRKSPILLLDEATSALDVATERQILKNLMQDNYPRTCIVTTHRPTVLNICDRVYAIKDKKCEILGEAEIKKMIDEF